MRVVLVLDVDLMKHVNKRPSRNWIQLSTHSFVSASHDGRVCVLLILVGR